MLIKWFGVGGIHQIIEHGVCNWFCPEVVSMYNFLSCPLINLSTMNVETFF